MAYFRFKASLQRPKNPQITFASVRDVMALSRLLAEKRGSQKAMDRFDCLVYAFLIYDHFSMCYRQSHGANWSQRESWRQLASHPVVGQIYSSSQRHLCHSRVIGDLTLMLPVQSNDPSRPNARAPQHLQPGEYRIDQLTCEQFVDVAYMVRCNLLHGSYDIADDATARLILTVGSRFVSLVWGVVITTAW
jgi:hypothetical protein